MTIDATHSLQIDVSTSSTEHILHTLLDEVSVLSEKVNRILQVLEVEESKTKRILQTAVHRQHVNEKVMQLLLKHPRKVWTSEDFAKEIGCSGAAVRQTSAWKAHRKTHEKARRNHPLPKGFKNKQRDIDAYAD